MTRSGPASSGFTLVEVMVSATIGGVVLAAVLSTYVFLGRNLARLSAYQALEQESRKALAYLSRDLQLTKAVKSGTTPTASTVTLVLPAGEVAYTFDSATKSLRRQATFGANQNFTLLRNDLCECTEFALRYYTTSDGAPTAQGSSDTYVPLSIKQVQVAFTLESPASWTAEKRTRFDAASARYVLRNRGTPDGT